MSYHTIHAPADAARTPHPHAVAWMMDYRRRNPEDSKQKCIREYVSAHSPDGRVSDIGIPLTTLVYSWDAAKPLLTVADIPAGQGAASLYRDTDGTVWFKEADGYQRIVLLSPDEMSRETPSGQALEAHLAATLPTVTEDAP